MIKKKLSCFFVVLTTLSLLGCGDINPINKNAVEFIKQYQQDTEVKQKSYVGKYMEWDGEVVQATKADDKNKTIIFRAGYSVKDKDGNFILSENLITDNQSTNTSGSNPSPIIVDATGNFDDDSIEKLKKGDKVKILGKFSEKVSDTEWKLSQSKIQKQ